MNGDITVASEPGQGTTFTMRIPVEVVPRPAERQAKERGSAEQEAQRVADSLPASAAVVLVIDDDPHGRRSAAAHAGERRLPRGVRRKRREGTAARAAIAAGCHHARRHDARHGRLAGDDAAEVGSGVGRHPGDSVVDRQRPQDRLRAGRDRVSDQAVRPRAVDARCWGAFRKGAGRGWRWWWTIIAENRELLRNALESDGWTVEEAGNGLEALDRLEHRRPDAILLDLMMPEMDGIAFVERLRASERNRSIPVLVVTAKEITPADRQRLSGGVQAIMQKGAVDLSELVAQTRALLTARTQVEVSEQDEALART